jgi:uracil-DNA glycosylase
MDKKFNNQSPQKKLSDYLTFLSQQPKGFVYKGLYKKSTMPPPTEKKSLSKKEKLDQLNNAHSNCMQCPLSTQGRKQVVFGNGNSQAKLMFIGEGPGRDEDEKGYPFIGRAGQLLTKIIEAMDLKREDVYISNVVKCRPPGNRAPLANESASCKELLLLKEINIIQPKIICTLGATATQALLGDNAKLSRTRGIFFDFKGVLILPTYHPAYLLRNPIEKKTVWEDMKKIIAKLKEIDQ